jgi:signal transduction histidine kinase
VGLALVRQIVELHGGTVQARSPGIGKGSEFSFRLPTAAAHLERVERTGRSGGALS